MVVATVEVVVTMAEVGITEGAREDLITAEGTMEATTTEDTQESSNNAEVVAVEEEAEGTEAEDPWSTETTNY